MALELPSATNETVYLPVRNDRPASGEYDLSGTTVEIALPVEGVAPSTWSSTTWETGTWRRGDERYHLAKVVIGSGGFTITAGNTYRAWCRIGGASGAVVKGGTVKAINT